MAMLPLRLRPLQIVKNEELNCLLKKQSRACVIKYLSEHETDVLWSILSEAFGEQVNVMCVASSDPPQVECNENLIAAHDFVISVLYLAHQTVAVKDIPHIPSSLKDLLLALQAFLCNLVIPEDVQRMTAQLFVELYKKECLQPAECVNVLQYYLNCALTQTNDKWRTDIHKLWELRSLLAKINVQSDALRALRNLLQRCTVSERLLICENGQQFLTALLGADDVLLQNFISVMEKNLPKTNKEVAGGYGKLLVYAWGRGSDNQKQCIEDFVKKLYDDLAQLERKGIEMCQLGNIILRIFEMFHTDETPLLLKTNISRRCIPILFGYLKSHVNRQRCNASELFFRMYPLMMYSTRDKECSFLDKQHTLIGELLRDKCHIVRVLAIMGTCRIITENADTVPKSTVNCWLTIIVDELSQDSKSYLVRCYVSKGFKKLLSSRLSNAVLEGLLTRMNHLYGDVNAQVREAYSELLMKAVERDVLPRLGGEQPERGIRWWKIVQLKALLTQIELEDCGTRKWQASLLFHSTIVKDKSGMDIVQRIISLAMMNPLATNKLFIFMGKKLAFKQVVDIISAIILKINKYVERNRNQMYKVLAANGHKVVTSPLKRKKRKNLDKENVMDDDSSVTSEDSRSEELVSSCSLDRPAIMQTLLNIMSILWRNFMKTFEENPKELRDLHRICQACLTNWFSFFKGTVVFDCLLLLMTHLPADVVAKMSGLQMSLMSQLKQLPEDVPDATAKSVLVPLVLWGNGRDILELSQDWFNEAFRPYNLNWTLTTQGRRRKVSVIDAVPPKPLLAIRFLSIMYQHPICWDKLLAKCYPQLCEFWSFLERVKGLTVQRVEAGQVLDNELVNDNFIRESLRMYLKLIPFLGNADRNEQQFDAFANYSDAIEFAIQKLVPHIPENALEEQQPEHALVVNMLNDVLDIGCHPLLLVQPPIVFIRDMYRLASKVLKTSCGSSFVVVSLYLVGNVAVQVKGQASLVLGPDPKAEDREIFCFLYTKCVLHLLQLVLSRIPTASDSDLLLCFQEQEIFKTVMTNVLATSKLFIDSKSQLIMSLYLPCVDAVVELLSQDRDNVVLASSGKILKDLPFAAAKMVSAAATHREQAHTFCLALMYRFKQPYEDCNLLMAALKLLCAMAIDTRWTNQMLQNCLLMAEEAVSFRTSTMEENLQGEASKMLMEIQTRLKQTHSRCTQLETPHHVSSPHGLEVEEQQLDVVLAAPSQSEQSQSRLLVSSPSVPGSPKPSGLQLQDICSGISTEVGSQSPSSSMQVNASESVSDFSFVADLQMASHESEELPVVGCSSRDRSPLQEEVRTDEHLDMLSVVDLQGTSTPAELLSQFQL